MAKKTYDFSGWATRNNIKCADGRTIRENAFIENDGMTVPVVWDHKHDDPFNVLGHALLKNKKDGVYCYVSLNDTAAGRQAKNLVTSGDINALSIFANQLKQKGGDVIHGLIREVSLVTAGANPGAYIDSVLAHGLDSEDEAFIYTDEEISLSHSADEELEEPEEPENNTDENSDHLKHSDEENTNNMGAENTNTKTPAADEEQTVQDVLDSMTDVQRQVTTYLIGVAASGNDDDDDEEDTGDMNHNIFDSEVSTEDTLSHSDMNELCEIAMNDAPQFGGSFRESFLAHAEGDYGVKNIDILFPDAKAYSNDPEIINQEDVWASDIMSHTTHTPFSRIKTLFADLTEGDARAKGYIKGHVKKDIFFSLAKRTTQPTTVYVKSKIDRDDQLDATTIDALQWMLKISRIKLDEELAQAFLIGDKRDSSSEDKINEECIRPVLKMEDLFTVKVMLTAENVKTYAAMIEAMSLADETFEGSGRPALYITKSNHNRMLWTKDLNQRRLYESDKQLCDALAVDRIINTPPMKGLTYKVGEVEYDVLGIKVDLTDYQVGTDKGGEVNNFNQFDIDKNQQKYLMETRCSGSLVKAHSAQVFLAPKGSLPTTAPSAVEMTTSTTVKG